MQTNIGSISLPTNATLGKYLRVKMTGGYLALAGATDNEIGTLEDAVLAAGDGGAVIPKNAAGVVLMVLAGTVSAYTDAYGAANGCVDDTVNENFVGMFLDAGVAGDYVRVLRQVKADALDNLGAIDGNVVFDDDFLGDWPAAATALGAGLPWLKVETNGLGVIDSSESDGVKKFAFDATEEAATAALYMPQLPFDIDASPVFEARVAVFDIGDAAALDINIGLASGTHATDFDSVTNYVAFHLDGNDLSVECRSKATATVADTDTTVDLVDDTYANLKIDCTDKTDVKFYINGTRVLSGTTFDLTGWTGNITPIIHVEKTSDDTAADVRVDRVRVQQMRLNAA